jgi:putative ABC transport system permease protein
MRMILLAWAFLRRRWGQALLSVLVGALGVAAVESVAIAERELPRAAARAFGGVDMIVGPKGAALDLVLCCSLHVTDPRGLIPVKEAMAALHNPLVAAAAPMALGDSIHGHRIVGTTPDIIRIYHARLARGALWTEPLQVVLGAQAARELGLGPGDHFVGNHGLGEGGEAHDKFPYTVTGILAPTGSALDRLVLCDIQSVYKVHSDPDDQEEAAKGQAVTGFGPPAATAVLVSFRSPVAMASLPRMIDATPNFSAASPALEMARLARSIRPLLLGLTGVGVVFAFIAAAAAATALAAAMSGRARDLAQLRALGAHPWELAAIAGVEALILAAGALVLGLSAIALSGPWVSEMLAAHDGLVLDIAPSLEDMLLLGGGAAGAGILAALGPAIRAARAPMESLLKA